MDQVEVYHELCKKLDYTDGLIEQIEQSRTPAQRQMFYETKRLVRLFEGLYFSGDDPIAFFKTLSEYNVSDVARLHKTVWNQNKIPFLFIITPKEIRIYNAFEEPANIGKEPLDTEQRLVRFIDLTVDTLDCLSDFSSKNFEMGIFWKTEIGKRLQASTRVDERLMSNLKMTRKILHNKGISYEVIHNLLGRSIFILYLEDRGAIDKNKLYSMIHDGEKSFLNLTKDKTATYSLFEKIQTKFDGDLFKITDEERQTIDESDLKLVGEFTFGTDVSTGQRTLWRPYDFGVISIEFISAIYEEFLEKDEKKDSKSAFYTTYELVEFIMDQVLPWPSENDGDYRIKIMDPACGSGIFLVEAYRRLIARWMYTHKTTKISAEELKKILREHIYGVDIDIDAIRVAAFSLYLALLDYLEPKDFCRDFHFPSIVCSPYGAGNNLFKSDIADKLLPFNKLEYDIIVGNPPWKRRDLSGEMSSHLKERKFPLEKAVYFFERAIQLAPNGKIALLITSKTLFNKEGPDLNFRRALLKENYVESIINLSAQRRRLHQMGKQTFENAVCPASIVIFKPTRPIDENSLLYCTPKPTPEDSLFLGIKIDPLDIKVLPRDIAESDDAIWKAAMWGTYRDYKLIKKLQKRRTLADHIHEDAAKGKWRSGRGFQPNEAKSSRIGKRDSRLTGKAFLNFDAMDRYWVDPNDFQINKWEYFYRPGNLEAYRAPHVLIKKGQIDKRFCAAYSDHDCTYRDCITGLVGPPNNTSLLKAITAYLNSSFAFYYLFLTTSSWGVERPMVYPSEALSLPDLPFTMDKENLTLLASYVDEIIELKKVGVDNNNYRLRSIEKQIDNVIYNSLKLTRQEKILMEDVLTFGVNYYQNGMASGVFEATNLKDLVAYAQNYCQSLNSILSFSDSCVTSTVYVPEATSCLVVFDFSQDCGENEIKVIESSALLQESLNKIIKSAKSSNQFQYNMVKNIRLYEKDKLYIIRPNEKRFWTRSAAISDADETINDSLEWS